MRGGGVGRRPVSRGDVVVPGGVGRRHGHRVAHPVCRCRAALAARALVVLMGGAAPRVCWGRVFFFREGGAGLAPCHTMFAGWRGAARRRRQRAPRGTPVLVAFPVALAWGGGSENKRSLVTTRLDGHKGGQLQYRWDWLYALVGKGTVVGACDEGGRDRGRGGGVLGQRGGTDPQWSGRRERRRQSRGRGLPHIWPTREN